MDLSWGVAIPRYLLEPWGRYWAHEVRVRLVRQQWKPVAQAELIVT